MHRPPRQSRGARPRPGRQAQGSDSPAAISGCDPRGDRREDHRARNHQRLAQRRYGEMLRRRYHAQTQAPGEAKGRQEAHEIYWLREHSAGSVYRSVKDMRGLQKVNVAALVRARLTSYVAQFGDFAISRALTSAATG